MGARAARRPAGPLLEALLHAVERRKKAIASSTTSPPHLRHRAQERLGGDVDGLDDAPGRRHEHAVEPVVEEAGEAAGGVEEVEGVARGRRVDDDQVEVARPRAARRASPSPCTPGCPTARWRCCGRSGCRGSRSACCRVGGVLASPARRRSSWCRASAPTARRASRPRCDAGLVVELVEARARRPGVGRVDGDDARPGGPGGPPPGPAPRRWWSCRRRPSRCRSRCRAGRPVSDDSGCAVDGSRWRARRSGAWSSGVGQW